MTSYLNKNSQHLVALGAPRELSGFARALRLAEFRGRAQTGSIVINWSGGRSTKKK